MTDRTQHCAGCYERQAEIDRLRLLNEALRMQRDAARAVLERQAQNTGD
jgi:hypothetical protein